MTVFELFEQADIVLHNKNFGMFLFETFYFWWRDQFLKGYQRHCFTRGVEIRHLPGPLLVGARNRGVQATVAAVVEHGCRDSCHSRCQTG